MLIAELPAASVKRLFAIRSMFPAASLLPVPYRCSGGRLRNGSYDTWLPRCHTLPPSFQNLNIRSIHVLYIPCRCMRSTFVCQYLATCPRYIPCLRNISSGSAHSCHYHCSLDKWFLLVRCHCSVCILFVPFRCSTCKFRGVSPFFVSVLACALVAFESSAFGLLLAAVPALAAIRVRCQRPCRLAF